MSKIAKIANSFSLFFLAKIIFHESLKTGKEYNFSAEIKDDYFQVKFEHIFEKLEITYYVLLLSQQKNKNTENAISYQIQTTLNLNIRSASNLILSG